MNLYYEPESFGLDIIWSHSEGDAYDWQIEALFMSKDDGRIYFGSDGGCSCDFQFNDWGVSDLIEIRTRKEARQEMGPVIYAELTMSNEPIGHALRALPAA